MLNARPGPLESAFPIIAAAAAALAPEDAEACPYYGNPCDGADGWASLDPVNGAKIPADGVLVLQGEYHGPSQEDSLATITFEVTKDGQPIAGALEGTVAPGVLVWRPTDPWEPGATYDITGSITNAAPTVDCVPDSVMIGGTATIDAAPGVVPEPTLFAGTVNYFLNQLVTLDTLVCCEDATPPTLAPGGCGDYYVTFAPGQCAPTMGHGYFTVDITGMPTAEDPIAGQILYIAKIGEEVVARSFVPDFSVGTFDVAVCFSIDTVDLGTGTVVPGVEKWFGDDIVDQLGPQVLHPEDELTCPLQSCEVSMDGMGWDTTMCTPYPDGPDNGSTGAVDSESDGDSDNPTGGEPTGGGTDAGDSTAGATEIGSGPDDTTSGQNDDKGCGCTTTPASAPPLLLVAALALRRRRRA